MLAGDTCLKAVLVVGGRRFGGRAVGGGGNDTDGRGNCGCGGRGGDLSGKLRQ